MRIIGYIFLLIILVICFIFSVLNYQTVAFSYYFNTIHISLALLLVITFVIGVLLTLIIMGFAYWSLRAKNAVLSHQLKIQEKELANLRMSPIKDTHL